MCPNPVRALVWADITLGMMTPKPSPKTASKEELRLLWKMSGLAFQFGTEIIAGVLLGWGFDALFNTRPWGIVVGSIAGIAVGTTDLIRRAIQINRVMDANDRSGAGRSAGKGIQGASRSSGAPIPRQDGGRDDALDAEFEEALDHEQWKTLQDRRMNPGDEPEKHTEDHDDSDGTR
jgi:F0F1-type ATP synthase assembly protein I